MAVGTVGRDADRGVAARLVSTYFHESGAPFVTFPAADAAAIMESMVGR
jgi:hypothetical protein